VAYCEDYPCCGHTPLDPCERQPYDEPGYFDTSRPGNEHALCEHEAGFCDVDMDEEDEEDDEEDEDEVREEYQAHTPPDDEAGPDGIDDGHMTGADYYAYVLAQEGPRE